jgi:drug/metabolite transporter (DMT)-like permease
MLKKQSINLQAVFWIVLCKTCFVMMMALNKQSTIPTLEINFCRSFLIMCITAFVIASNKKLTFKTANPLLQFLKVSIGAFGMIGYFYGFRYLEMAHATTLDFSKSLILPLFAIFVLKEKINCARVIALLIGYAGILIALNPFSGVFEKAEAIMLIAALCGAFAVVMAKKLTAKDSPILLMFYSGVATAGLLGVYYIIPGLHLFGTQGQWVPLTWSDAPFFLKLVGISFVMQYSYLKAYSLSDVGFLATFDYAKLFISILFSLFLFDQLPTMETLLGAALIISSTFYLTKKELHKEPQYHYKK